MVGHQWEAVCVFVLKTRLILFSPHPSAAEQSDDTLQEEINKAHVVCIVYSVEDEDSLDRITSHWLPLIRDCTGGAVEQRKPVVLVGNKVDKIDYSTIDVSFANRVSQNWLVLNSVIPFAARPHNHGRLSRSWKLRWMFGKNASQYFRNVLLRTKGCFASNLSAVCDGRARRE